MFYRYLDITLQNDVPKLQNLGLIVMESNLSFTCL